jgi:hypothetical protein
MNKQITLSALSDELAKVTTKEKIFNADGVYRSIFKFGSSVKNQGANIDRTIYFMSGREMCSPIPALIFYLSLLRNCRKPLLIHLRAYYPLNEYKFCLLWPECYASDFIIWTYNGSASVCRSCL